MRAKIEMEVEFGEEDSGYLQFVMAEVYSTVESYGGDVKSISLSGTNVAIVERVITVPIEEVVDVEFKEVKDENSTAQIEYKKISDR